jgi:CheY-like chemotaxis protein
MIKALYVDDDEDIASIVELCLELDESFEVRCLNSGKDAPAEAENWGPDVILLDYMMPDMDGPTTFNRLRKNPPTRETPVIFITAKSMQDDVAMLKDLGAAGVISKPFDPTTLASDIKSLLQG